MLWRLVNTVSDPLQRYFEVHEMANSIQRRSDLVVPYATYNSICNTDNRADVLLTVHVNRIW